MNTNEQINALATEIVDGWYAVDDQPVSDELARDWCDGDVEAMSALGLDLGADPETDSWDRFWALAQTAVRRALEPRREQDRIRRASEFLSAQRDDDAEGNERWRYYASEIGADCWIDDRAMIDLGARLESASDDREDADEIYSRWCADTDTELAQ